MSELDGKFKTEIAEDDSGESQYPGLLARARAMRSRHVLPVSRVLPTLLTVLVATVAAILGCAMWHAYMDAPWTRDATVRSYVVTMAPEVSGRIVELPVHDNQLVHKGELLVAIDPTNYAIAVSQATAAVQQAEANGQNIDAQMEVQQAQIRASHAQLNQAEAGLVFAQQQARRYRTLAHEGWGTVQSDQQYASQLHQQEAAVQTAQANLNLAERQVESLRAQRLSVEATLAQANAQLHQAQVNLARTRILSPAEGYVTNLLVQPGDYLNVGMDTISVVDANAFWVDAYFEETNLTEIHEGDPAQIKLMGYDRVLRGQVASIARAINVANAQPNGQGVATVNPIFTWVRLAQRIPVRIHIGQVPAGVALVAGMTATVQIDSRLDRQ